MGTIFRCNRMNMTDMGKMIYRVVTDDDEASFDATFRDLVGASTGSGLDREWQDLDMDKSWGRLGYLLDAAGPPPLEVFTDGLQVTERNGGPWDLTTFRLLLPDQVQSVSQFMDATPIAKILPHVDCEAMIAAGVYSSYFRKLWNREEVIDGFASHYRPMTRFFAKAARNGEAILTWYG